MSKTYTLEVHTLKEDKGVHDILRCVAIGLQLRHDNNVTGTSLFSDTRFETEDDAQKVKLAFPWFWRFWSALFKD